jgi:hypothetical protein
LTEKSISSAEGWAVLAFCMAASAAAIIWSWRHGAMLNYGDAVAHLHIARRVFDSRTPRFSQLGSVWLPLPHILLLPFVQNYFWWATGLAAIIPSSLSYVASCVGIHRLARNWLDPAPAALVLLFFALNPNLLYLQTTAMTEPLFLCEFIWIVVWLVEWRAAIDSETAAASFELPVVSSERTEPERAERERIRPRSRFAASIRRPLRVFEAPGPVRGAWLRNPSLPPAPRTNIPITQSARLQACIAVALVAAIFTRYDGWIIAFITWSGIAITLLLHAARGERGRLAAPAFWLATLAIVAAPLLWFLYNSVSFGDWLYFARGPYSAHAIELRTATQGSPLHPSSPLHPGWHDPWVALLFYLKVSELDSVAAPGWGNLWGNIVFALAAVGSVGAWLAEKSRTNRRALAWIFLLWLPVPFYAWSVAYGSVPIFFPAWWPFTWYNTRYGLELLPALALGIGFAAQLIAGSLRRIKIPTVASVLPKIAFAVLLFLACLNAFTLLRSDPIVYVEGTKNADAREPYDDAIPPALQSLLSLDPRAPVLMNTSDYPEIVAFTGIPLSQTINESDLGIYRSALASPATHAAIIVAFDGDDIDKSVRAHLADLTLMGAFTADGQPSAAIYVSTKWLDRSHATF